MDGETITIYRRHSYVLHYIKPCTMEKGKKMAKVQLQQPPGDVLARVEKGPWDECKVFADVGVANIRYGRKYIMVFATGEIAIRAADDDRDVIATAELIAGLVKGKA